MTSSNDIKHVLAFSGGIDSTLILATEPIDLCIFVDYGQPAAHAEHAASMRLANRFDTPLEVIVQPLQLREMADEDGKPGPRVVPGRNLAIAAACINHFPEPGGYLYFGAHADDAELYPDCRSQFWDYLTCATTPAYGVGIAVPNIRKTKPEVIAELATYCREWSFQCWSCYTPLAGPGDQLKPCGTCDSCVARNWYTFNGDTRYQCRQCGWLAISDRQRDAHKCAI